MMRRYRGPSLEPPDNPQEIMWEAIEAWMGPYIEGHVARWHNVTRADAHAALAALLEADSATSLVLDGIIAWAMQTGSDASVEAAADGDELRGRMRWQTGRTS